MSARKTTTLSPADMPVMAVKNRKPSPFIGTLHSLSLYHVLYLITLDPSISRPGFPYDLVDPIMTSKIIIMASTSLVGPVFFIHCLCYSLPGSGISLATLLPRMPVPRNRDPFRVQSLIPGIF
jgi:hypothetical protein